MNLEDYHKLDDVTGANGERVIEWPNKEVFDDYTLYWKPQDAPLSGFEFVITEWATGMCGEPAETYVEKIAMGTALFDGVRHIWFACSPDSEFVGYLNYPDILQLYLVLGRVRELEVQHCEGL